MPQPQAPRRDQTPQRILVIRFSSIGDILLTTPVLRLLRQAYPTARLEFLTKATYQDVLRANPCVDDLHLLEQQRLTTVAAEPAATPL